MPAATPPRRSRRGPSRPSAKNASKAHRSDSSRPTHTSKPNDKKPVEVSEQLPSKVSFIEVSEDQHGQRIDNFLRTAIKGVPKTLIYRLLRKGEIRVNKKRIKPDGRVSAGDTVRLPPMRTAADRKPPVVAQGLLDHLEVAVLYESDALMVVNKPAGLAVHGGSGINLGLIEALRQLRPDARFLELVHRLDRDTSGCIMVAKKRSMLRHLHQLLRENHQIDKVYWALVVGKWPGSQQKVDAPLRKSELTSGERIVRVDGEGKACLTRYKVLNRYRKETLVEAKPITGRTHQIRVHCQFAGHPILGDDKYGVSERNSEIKEQGLRRLFLHAARLSIVLPDGDKLTVEAPLGPELQQVLDNLAKATSANTVTS